MGIRDKYKQEPKDLITIYCDGSGNNKKHAEGGIGIVLIYKGQEKHISLGSYYSTTTARMELKAIIEALRLVKNKTLLVNLFADNQYCIHGYSKGWYLNWIKDKWRTIKKDKWGNEEEIERPNKILWLELISEIEKFPKGNVNFYHVKGHNGDLYNEICDQLAKEGGKKGTMIMDIPMLHLGDNSPDLPF